MAYTYNTNPSPRTGQGAYGLVPGAIGIPPTTYSQVGDIYPNQAAQTGQLSSNIGNELAGQLSPETIAALQQHAAQFGVQSGMPGSQFSGNQGLAQLGLNTEALQQQGQKDYLSASQELGGMQTPQSLAAEIASSNATLGAAPDPAQAASEQLGQWMAKFNAASGGKGGYRLNSAAPSGGPAGGTGSYAGPNYTNPTVSQPNLSGLQIPGYSFDNTTGQYTANSQPLGGWTPGSGGVAQGAGSYYAGEAPSTDVSTNDYGIPNYYDTGPAGGSGEFTYAPQ